jgi:hypothetical protein
MDRHRIFDSPVKKKKNRNILQSRYWFGENVFKIALNDVFCNPLVVNSFANTSYFRRSRITRSFIEGFWVNLTEEMNCLKLILPHYLLQLKKEMYLVRFIRNQKISHSTLLQKRMTVIMKVMLMRMMKLT